MAPSTEETSAVASAEGTQEQTQAGADAALLVCAPHPSHILLRLVD